MLIIDGDYPMAGGATLLQRDLTLPIDQVRNASSLLPEDSSRPNSGTMASLPELRRGRVAAAIVKVGACILRKDLHPHGEVRSDEIAYSRAQGEMAYYRILESRGQIRLLKAASDFGEHMQVWEQAGEYDTLPIGMVLGMEGADPILFPEQVHEWYADGLRVISLSHYGVSRYSHGTGTGTEGGLLDGARRPPQEHGLARHDLGRFPHVRRVDTTGAGQLLRACALDAPELPGNYARRTPDLRRAAAKNNRPGGRHRPLDGHVDAIPGRRRLGQHPPAARRVPRRRGYVGGLLRPYRPRVPDGRELHSAIGGDTDGQGGADGAPYEVDTIADYQKVADVLDRRGYAQADIENIMYRNWQRFFEEWLP